MMIDNLEQKGAGGATRASRFHTKNDAYKLESGKFATTPSAAAFVTRCQPVLNSDVTMNPSIPKSARMPLANLENAKNGLRAINRTFKKGAKLFFLHLHPQETQYDEPSIPDFYPLLRMARWHFSSDKTSDRSEE
ncbi:hypothetical protein G6N82_12320 [Altererythrobacter sp. BO-6]|uniref:hypothetical protein n=1 Tax=Altererythrobacter sp. BO-6 TaxID=2604537 RepID=UPI0013E19B1C|nr:hypothetical protein [Altererythrobacter sp. BO-6]QIG54835.1 hypothetical protein G6N82_12320 [Altererythrobacter sp. BO-6]